MGRFLKYKMGISGTISANNFLMFILFPPFQRPVVYLVLHPTLLDPLGLCSVRGEGKNFKMVADLADSLLEFQREHAH